MITVNSSSTRGEVLMFANEFENMKEYHPQSLPPQRDIGYRWIVDLNYDNPEATEHRWYMGEFVDNVEDKDMLDICWRKINLINAIIEIVASDNIGGIGLS
jgi:hypothetical protein